METIEAFEPLDYEEEFTRFGETVATNLEKFQRSCDDIKKIEYNDNSFMANSEKVNAALQSFVAALNHRENVASELTKEEQYVRDLAKDIREVSELEVDSSKRLAEMNEAADKKKSQLAAKRTQTSSSRDLFEEKKGKISGELEKWKRTLGLELIVSTHGGIIFSFSNVIRDSPEKTFTCELEASKTGKVGRYVVKNCAPAINDIEEMVTVLNCTNDLSGFAVTLRKKFASI